MEGTVYVIQIPPPFTTRDGKTIQKDLSSAQRYGAINVLLGEKDQPSLTPGPCLHKITRRLKDFDSERDFICYAGGDAMAVGLVTAALQAHGIREFTYLRWERNSQSDGPSGFYVPVEVSFKQ